MEDKKIKTLQESLANLRRELALLTVEAKDFPAIERNAARISANLSMMEITLGMVNSTMDRS